MAAFLFECHLQLPGAMERLNKNTLLNELRCPVLILLMHKLLANCKTYCQQMNEAVGGWEETLPSHLSAGNPGELLPVRGDNMELLAQFSQLDGQIVLTWHKASALVSFFAKDSFHTLETSDLAQATPADQAPTDPQLAVVCQHGVGTPAPSASASMAQRVKDHGSCSLSNTRLANPHTSLWELSLVPDQKALRGVGGICQTKAMGRKT